MPLWLAAFFRQAGDELLLGDELALGEFGTSKGSGLGFALALRLVVDCSGSQCSEHPVVIRSIA
ncbi:MAG: hypothetical protein CMN30_18635 [Sandaracinus sp.]|nr:hypothetical protein [Sandaracinus sp.]